MSFSNTEPVELTPDFTIAEEMVGDSLQILWLLQERPETWTFLMGMKKKNEEPFYSFGWRTRLSASDAGNFLLDVDELEGMNTGSGDFTIRSPKGTEEYRWAPAISEKHTGQKAGCNGLNFREADLLRLETDDVTFGWSEGFTKEIKVPPPTMWVVTTKSIASAVVEAFQEKTAEDATKAVIAKNLGAISSRIETFLSLPFGEPTEVPAAS